MATGIYGLQNKLKPTRWYVGQSKDIEHRWNRHYKHLHCKTQPKIYRALKRYGYDNFEKVILEECPIELLNEREAYWATVKNSIEKGYNCAQPDPFLAIDVELFTPINLKKR
jgi:group I intron endonuclease